MSYTVEVTSRFEKDFKKLDAYTKKFIRNWIDKNLQGCENPRLRGKPLSANLAGVWRYRIGDYRLLCTIEDNRLIITALTVGHRSIVYKDK